MSATISKSNESSLRRERFREYMRRLNPTAPARATIESGLVVEDLHGSLFKTMAARADLDPGSQQLLVGGIGSGKTTELLMAEKWLEAQGQTLSVYIDISAETDLSGLNSGALLAGFGLHLTRAFSAKGLDNGVEDHKKEALKSAQSKIREFAFGKTVQTWVPDYDDGGPPEDYDDSDEEPGHFVFHNIPGKLKPRFPVFQRDIQDIRDPLDIFIHSVQTHSLDVVVIFDGLDRLISPDKFWAVVDQDFRSLRRMRVAVLAAAPLSVLYGAGRSISEHFDRIHHIHTLGSTPESADQLKSVLNQRGGGGLLGADEAALICSSSGGVLRDLVTLARDAGEAAYIEGSEKILSRHAKAAVKQMGESYLRGLGPEQLRMLRRVDQERFFDASSRPSIELLVTGRVLEYSASDFRVHPALRPLIPTPDGNA
jgi:hypothetical protein